MQPTGSKISPRSCPIARRSKYGFDAIAETAEFSDHLGGSTLCTRFDDKRAAFFVRDAIVQDLPHEPTQPMRDRPDRLGMAQTDDEPPVQELEDTTLGLHRGMRSLISNRRICRLPF